MTKIDQKGRIILGDSMKSKDKGKKYIKVTLKNIIICCSFAIIILCCISFYNYYFNKNEVYAKETNNIKTDNIKISNAQLMNLDEIVNNNTQNKQKEEYITEEIDLEYIEAKEIAEKLDGFNGYKLVGIDNKIIINGNGKEMEN